MPIPVIPALPAGYVVQLADMQALAYAATFLLNKPMTRLYDANGGQAITTTPTAVLFTTIGFDQDGAAPPGSISQLTIQTPGWYKVRYGVNCGTAGGTYVSSVISTTGPSNPAGAGIVSSPAWGGYSDGTATGAYAGASGVWHDYLYPGDFLQVLISAAAAGGSTGTGAPGGATTGGSYFSVEYVSTT